MKFEELVHDAVSAIINTKLQDAAKNTSPPTINVDLLVKQQRGQVKKI